MNTRKLLDYIEAITIIIFTLEYVLHIVIAEKKFRYIFSLRADLVGRHTFILYFGWFRPASFQAAAVDAHSEIIQI